LIEYTIISHWTNHSI